MMRSCSLFSRGVIAALCALILSVSFAGAQTSEVYSLNVVGFQKATAWTGTTRLIMVAPPFVTASSNINEVIGPQLFGSNNSAASANIWLWDYTAQTYRTYWLAGDISGSQSNKSRMWLTGSGAIASNAFVSPGQGFWIRQAPAGSTQTVVFSGDVIDIPTNSISIGAGMQMVSYPFNAPIDLNATKFAANGAYGSNNSASSDNIWLWDTTAQTYRTYWLAGDISGSQSNKSRKWLLGSGAIASNIYLNAGQGFWYRHRSTGFTWKEPKPYMIP